MKSISVATCGQCIVGAATQLLLPTPVQPIVAKPLYTRQAQKAQKKSKTPATADAATCFVFTNKEITQQAQAYAN
ncbi:hypothetical protein STCU_12304 [Strigomonas culicis]|uniref:Uncharacterized protein n=1 Tax=Strigomonas culicis TaxID=28005 RepID=S9TB01_9TRYP|nr:hypothetical protein STCU_12304 [Strigomonas culicis]|eukprot:EPY15157.1 hypothetical protein STCU_12304 [Strigomonas culicis]